jgi:hypothetical protein
VRRARIAAALTAVLALGATATCAVATPAFGGDVSPQQAAELASEAGADPAALAELRSVTSIEGRPGDLAAALDGAGPDELEGRLAALERALATPDRGDADPAAARADAEEIVGGFPAEEEPAADEGSSGDGSSDGIGLDVGGLWLPLLIVAAIVGALVGLRLARNRETAGRLAAEGEEPAPEEGLDELAIRAERAERAGDFEEALRLHYAIALRALQRSGAVPAAPSVTPARVSRDLGDPRAERLVGTFERVVYGGRSAAAEDAREARDEWPAVVRERAVPDGTGAGAGAQARR